MFSVLKTEKELLIATLIVFFKEAFTQGSYKTIADLMNMVSVIKVPNTFNSLYKRLFSITGDSLEFNKIWYCEVCFKKVEKLEHRFQRMCVKCKSRYCIFVSLFML